MPNLTLSDSIVASDYDAAATLKVTPAKLGDVTVTTDPDTVAAGEMVDLEVRYTATEAMSFGRIQVTLPTSQTINPKRQNDPDLTYVTVDPSRSSVVLPTDVNGDPDYLSIEGDTVTIDVDSMPRRQYVTLTVHNINIDASIAPRPSRYADVAAAMLMNTVQVTVLSDQYTDADLSQS